MGKKRKASVLNSDENKEPKLNSTPETEVPLIRDSDEPVAKKGKWTNKQRVLVFAARGATYRDRHLMEDIRTLLPHSKSESKKEKKDDLRVINEIAEMKNCNKCIYFEGRKRKDTFMWVSNITRGPSVKFQVLNAHTMKEMKMTGNCLKGSRPMLSFDTTFSEQPHYMLMKELLTQTFGTPNHHPKSQPFFDHVFTFSVLDNKIWFRNFQIIEEDGQLAEIGPRFVLDPIKIFEDSFGGATLWENSHYVNPNLIRREAKAAHGMKYQHKIMQKQRYAALVPKVPMKGDSTNEVFRTKPPEEAQGPEKKLFIRKKN